MSAKGFSVEDLSEWLQKLGLEESDALKAANILEPKGYNKPSRFGVDYTDAKELFKSMCIVLNENRALASEVTDALVKWKGQKDAIAEWLESKTVDKNNAKQASDTLWGTPFMDDLDDLLILSVEELKKKGLTGNVAKRIHEKAQNEVPTKKQATILTRARASGCSAMTGDDLVELSKAFYQEHNIHQEPDADHAFIDRVRERQELEKVLTPVVTAQRYDKRSKLLVEYATISGAGKTRWMFHAFRNWKRVVGEDTLEASVAHLNFNVADRSHDYRAVKDLDIEPGHAAARLLLSRGLIHCEPDLTWIMEGKMKDSDLPKTNAIMDAIFKSRFDDGKGLLVVHLDELHLLRKNMVNLHLSLIPEHERKEKREYCVEKVSQWLKSFYYQFCGLADYSKQRFVVAVITHTSPGGRIIGDNEFSSIGYAPLRLFPFTMDQSWDLLNAARSRNNLSPLGDGRERRWSACVALAGGHTSLLLDAYSTLTTVEDPGYNETAVAGVMKALTTNHRVQKSFLDGEKEENKIDPSLAWSFVEKVLKCEVISDRNSGFEPLYNVGLAWYLPLEDTNRRGHVSAPFPYFLQLMQKAGGMYAIIGDQLDPTKQEYEPTKAMEYVAALAVMLKERDDTDTWASIAVPHGKAIETIETATDPFMTVWTSASETATDFGGKIRTQLELPPPSRELQLLVPQQQLDHTVTPGLPTARPTTASVSTGGVPTTGSPTTATGTPTTAAPTTAGPTVAPGLPTASPTIASPSTGNGLKAIVGQVKMQRPGKDTAQNLREVMNVAWFIGRSVTKGALTGPVHAYFVSSRRAPNMTNLRTAFLVAMSGSTTEAEAEELAKKEYGDLPVDPSGKKKRRCDIRNVIKYLALKMPMPAEVPGKYQFTYVGRRGDDSTVDETFVEMSALLPRGIFAHWC